MSERTPRQAKTTQRDDAFYSQCLRYIDGDLNEQQFAAFQDQLDADERLRKQYVELNVLCEWIAEASDAEHANDALTMAELYTRNRLTPISERNAQHSAREVFSLAGYIAMQGLRTKAGIIGSVAAVLLLGAALYLSFIGLGTEPNTQEIADSTAVESNDPHKPTESALPILRDQTVATLTATHNAQWDSQPAEDLRRGTKLHPNDRLTLTAGFAEITTGSGAIAILEAPCVVELKDNDNALRLISGKLVGICETESSKGFVVHARDARIVDLGTEFGVSVSDQAVTATVFTGDIVLATPDHKPQPLTTNQTVRVTDKGDSPSVVVEDQVAAGFSRRLPWASGGTAIELTRVEQLDLTNVVHAYNFTSDNQDLLVNGVTFQAYNVLNGVASNGLTLDRGLNNVKAYDSGYALPIGDGADRDTANLSAILDTSRNGQQGLNPDNDMLLTVSGLPNGTYKVQYLMGAWGSRNNTLYYRPRTGLDIELGRWQTARSHGSVNLLIAGEVQVTDGKLRLVLGAQDQDNDERRLISGLIISALPDHGPN